MSRPFRALASAIALALSGNLNAADIVVTDGGDAGTATTCTLRQAIASVNTQDTVGSCAVTGTLDGNYTIEFDATLSGSSIALNGSELTVTHAMTIHGTGQTIDAGAQSRVMSVVSTSLAFDDLNLINGRRSQLGQAGEGGGLYVDKGSVTISNSTISGNSSGYRGGGLFANQSTVTLVGSTLSNNSTYDLGGGLYAFNQSAVTLTDCVLSGNSTQVSNGAAARATLSSLAIIHSVISGNTSGGRGGGVSADESTFDLVDSKVFGNTAAIHGGALDTYDTSVSILRSTIDGNHADRFGGGVYAFGVPKTNSVVTLLDSTVSNNTSGAEGGGMGGGGIFNITDSTLSGNSSATSGGAVWGGYNAIFHFTNATIAGNSAMSGGGVSATWNSVFTIDNTVLVANTASSSANDLQTVITARVSASYSLLPSELSSTFSGNSNVFSDAPQLGPLQDNGGATQTRALLPTSPAIDSGSNTIASNSQATTDQTGFSRIYNGTVDIGAYEFRPDEVFASGFE